MSAWYRDDGTVRNAQGYALSGIQVFVCTQPVTSENIPPSPLATLAADSTGTPLANPVLTDGQGNFFFYAAPGLYTVILNDPEGNRIPITIFPDQLVASPGGGSVTSVAVTVPSRESVSGSPVTTSGTIAITDNVENANKVFAGPASGPSAAPTFRNLVAADIVGLSFGVTSVQLAVVVGPAFSASVTGTNPITSSGTFTLNLNFANQAANLILAGPSSGSPATPTFRAVTPPDLAAASTTLSGTTITLQCGLYNFFPITLNQNITGVTFAGGVTGARVTLKITQTGSFTFAWPANVLGWSNVTTEVGVYMQDFVYDGTNWRATDAGSFNAT